MKNDICRVTLIHNSSKKDDKKARLLADSLSGYFIQPRDLSKNPMTDGQLTDLLGKMNLHVEDIMDQAYDDHISVHNQGLMIMDRHEMLSLMSREPKLISTPILVMGNKAYSYDSACKLAQNMNARASA